MSVSSSVGLINVAIADGTEQEAQETAEEGNQQTSARRAKAASSDSQDWLVEVYSGATGVKVASQKVGSQSCTLSTIGWMPGMYVVRAVVGEDVLTEKVFVK